MNIEGLCDRCHVSPSEVFRKQADIANQVAAKSSKEANKTFWLRLAGDWLKLAETAAETDRKQLNQSRRD
jgi:hypothetical protein